MAVRVRRAEAAGGDSRRVDRWLVSLLCGVAWTTLALTGCGGGQTPPASGGNPGGTAGFGSPQAVFDAEKQAQLDEDWGTLFDAYTPESRDKLVGMTAFGAVMVASSAGKEEEVKAVFQKHGIDESKIPKKPSVTDMAGMQAAFQEMAGQQAEMISLIKDKREFFVEMAALVNDSSSVDARVKEQVEASRKAQAAATLTDLRVLGSTAAGTRQFTANGQQVKLPVYFQEIDGSWYLRQPDTE